MGSEWVDPVPGNVPSFPKHWMSIGVWHSMFIWRVIGVRPTIIYVFWHKTMCSVYSNKLGHLYGIIRSLTPLLTVIIVDIFIHCVFASCIFYKALLWAYSLLHLTQSGQTGRQQVWPTCSRQFDSWKWAYFSWSTDIGPSNSVLFCSLFIID